MRCLIKFETNIATNDKTSPAYKQLLEQLQLLFKRSGWWPAKEQDDPIVIEQKKLILDTIYDDQGVIDGYAFMIHDETPGTALWGIVSISKADATDPRNFEIRIRGDDLEVLKVACERLLESMQNALARSDSDITLKIKILAKGLVGENADRFPGVPRAEAIIYEAKLPRAIYVGYLLNPGDERNELATQNRKTEVAVVQRMLLIGFGLSLFTIPGLSDLAPQIAVLLEWLFGIAGRVATAAFFAALATYVNFLLYRSTLNKQPIVMKWVPLQPKGINTLKRLERSRDDSNNSLPG